MERDGWGDSCVYTEEDMAGGWMKIQRSICNISVSDNNERAEFIIRG